MVFYLSCPKCGYATFENRNLTKDGQHSYIIFGFLAAPEDSSLVTLDQCGERVIESRLHCDGCRHLFGSDWFIAGIDYVAGTEVKE